MIGLVIIIYRLWLKIVVMIIPLYKLNVWAKESRGFNKAKSEFGLWKVRGAKMA